MDLKIAGKTALITGSTKGIGFATALGLAKEGTTVWLNGRSTETVEEAKQRLLALVPEADVNGIAADLSTAEGCKQVTEALPAVDILVNNLGIFEPKEFEEIPDEDWFRFFETKFTHPAVCHTGRRRQYDCVSLWHRLCCDEWCGSAC